MIPNDANDVRVAHIFPWDNIGGIEIATVRLMKQTRRLGVMNVAFCPPGAGVLRRLMQREEFETVDYTPPEPSLRRISSYIAESQKLKKQLKHINANIVHFADIKAASHAGLAARLHGGATVSHVRSRYDSLSVREIAILRLIPNFIFVSQDARRHFALRVSSDRSCVIYDGIDPVAALTLPEINALKSSLGIPTDALIVGMVARVAPVKDYFTLGRAAKKVLDEHDNVRFLVVGDNSLTPQTAEHFRKISDFLCELGILDKFIFTGFRDDVLAITSCIDVPILCTHREGLPLSVLEPMALKKAVIATSVGGIPEVINHAENGFLHEHENEECLAGAICRLILEPQLRQTLGRQAEITVRQRFDPTQSALEVISVYNRLLRRTGSSSRFSANRQD